MVCWRCNKLSISSALSAPSVVGTSRSASSRAVSKRGAGGAPVSSAPPPPPPRAPSGEAPLALGGASRAGAPGRRSQACSRARKVVRRRLGSKIMSWAMRSLASSETFENAGVPTLTARSLPARVNSGKRATRVTLTTAPRLHASTSTP